MKHMTLHIGSAGNRRKLIVNPLFVAYAQESNGVGVDGYNAIVFAAGTAFPVAETVDEIESLLNEAMKEAKE